MADNHSDLIARTRLRLLTACYTVTSVGITLCMVLLFQYYAAEVREQIQRYLIVSLAIGSITATGQFVYNERLLRPISAFLEQKKSINLQNAAVALFISLFAFAMAMYFISSLLLGTNVSFISFLLTSLVSTSVSTILLILMLRGSDHLEVNSKAVANAAVELPLKSAFISLVLWLLAGPLIGLFFHYWAGMSALKSYAVATLLMCVGVMGFPVQYFAFKRITATLQGILIERGIRPDEGTFRLSYRLKLLTAIASVAIFCIGFFGLLNMMKADKILRDQTRQLLTAAIDGIGDNTPELRRLISETSSRVGAAAFIIRAGQLEYSDAGNNYDDLLKHIASGDNKGIAKAVGDNLLVSRNISGSDITFGLIYPDTRFKPFLAQVRNNAIEFALITFLFVTVLAVLTYQDINTPLQSIGRKIEEFGEGVGEWKDHTFYDDESADLAIGFKKMTKEIKKQLERSAMLMENINLTLQHLSSSAGEMEAITKEQAAGMAEQAAAIQEALTTAGEIAASARHIAESTMTVDSVVSDTAGKCGSSSDLIVSAIQGMDDVREKVNLVAHSMLDLGGKSQRIGGAVEIIQEISEQTNMLSLNASIEASSAGEEGRRFGVVAREIRRLGEGTVDASHQIKMLIDEIQRSANGAIVQVEESTKAVESWARLVSEIGEAFQNIESLVESASRAVREIKTNTRQQTTACEQLAEVIAEVKQVADKVVVSSKETEVSMSDLTELTVNLRDLTHSEEN